MSDAIIDLMTVVNGTHTQQVGTSGINYNLVFTVDGCTLKQLIQYASKQARIDANSKLRQMDKSVRDKMNGKEYPLVLKSHLSGVRSVEDNLAMMSKDEKQELMQKLQDELDDE